MAPEYILNNWTDEMFTLMCRKLTERKQREMESIQSPGIIQGGLRKISDSEMFQLLGDRVEIKKNAD